MKLADYLTANKIRASEFARLVSSSRQNVSRWASGRAVPRPVEMLKITQATKGRVTANDFFGIVSSPTAKPKPERLAG